MTHEEAKDRFMAWVRNVGDCWHWIGAKDRGGYGNFFFNGRSVLAHRFAYELFVGPIPHGKQIDHLCRNRACQNPSHMEPVTQRENILRGVAPPAVHARATHCRRGHEFTAENTRITKNGGRQCRRCSTINTREWRQKQRAA